MKHKNIIIISSVAISFIITFSFLIFALYEFGPNDTCKLQYAFYSQHFNDTKKIIILGSSQTARVDATYMKTQLDTIGLNYTVYNLSSPGDVPTDRIWSLEKIFSMKPDIIVYGIGPRDLEKPVSLNSSYTKPASQLSDLHDEISRFLFIEKRMPYCTNFLKSPKVASLEIFRVFNRENPESEKKISEKDLPLFKYPQDWRIIKSYEELKIDSSIAPSYRGLDPESKNIIALEYIIQESQRHHVKILLYSTPQHELFLNKISDPDKQKFHSILQSFHDEFNIGVYFFDNRYSNLQIWSDTTHIAKNDKALVYTDDILKVILKEINR